jgi:hypothetical protein
MNPMVNGLERAGRRLLAAPTAVFVAVLTAGFAMASFARHQGFYLPNAGAGQKNVVLACPRTKTNAHPTTNGSGVKSPAPRQKAVAAAPHSPAASPTATVENASVPPEKHQTGKTGSSGGSLSVPLPEFNAPELSRFISPL